MQRKFSRCRKVQKSCNEHRDLFKSASLALYTISKDVIDEYEGVESESRASRIKIYDTFDRSAVKIHHRALISCSRVKLVIFPVLKLSSRNFFPVKRATQLRRSMRKTTSCKETSESPGCSSSLIGLKKFFLADQKRAIQTLLELVR